MEVLYYSNRLADVKIEDIIDFPGAGYFTTA